MVQHFIYFNDEATARQFGESLPEGAELVRIQEIDGQWSVVVGTTDAKHNMEDLLMAKASQMGGEYDGTVQAVDSGRKGCLGRLLGK